MKKELVIIKAYGDEPLIRRMHDKTEDIVQVTDDAVEGVVSIGFYRQDVFKYDSKLASEAESLYKCGKWNWDKLSPY